jgi:putative tricarboxylic transport membrane protein
MFFDISAVAQAFEPLSLLIMLVAVFAGLVVGALPGLTSTMAVALLVPVTYGMTMERGIILLVAVYVGAISGGLVAATLLNIPGTPSSVATTFDAYPMTQRGEAGKALAIGVFASFVGTVLSFIALVLVAPVLGSFALKFGPPEYFALVVFTLTCIISISRNSMIKGMIAACAGMLMACVGLSDTDGVSRFTFDLDMLQSGFNVMPVLIGMYAVSQILGEVGSSQSPTQIADTGFTLREFWDMVKLVMRSFKNVLRSALIGIGIGILPGIGPGLSNIVAYSQARAAAKDPESFGKGNPDGIIASETANNASIGGALIPLLTLGIPGDATTMMLLGAFMLKGIQPGPLLFRDHADLVGIVMAAVAISAVFMLLVQMQCIRLLIKALSTPRHLLYPIILALCVIGCFALNSSLDDAWIFLIMGLAGVLMNKLGFPLLPLVLGLILGKMAENELRVSLVMGEGSPFIFLTHPIALLFFAAAVASVVLSLYTLRKKPA